MTNGIGDFVTSLKEYRRLVSQVVAELKGDVPGHEFHGNQWTGGGGGSGGDNGSSGAESGGSQSGAGGYGNAQYSIDVGAAEYGGKIIHPSAQEPGKVQVTKYTYDENTEQSIPAGHQVYDSIGEAIFDNRNEVVGLPKGLEMAANHTRDNPDWIKDVSEAKKAGGNGKYVYISPYRPVSYDKELNYVNTHGGKRAVIFSDTPHTLETMLKKDIVPYNKDAQVAMYEAWARRMKIKK